MKNPGTTNRRSALPKALTGIQGLDEITAGGLPTGRPTLLCGSAGCGKTVLAMEFLVHGALEYGEPGVFMAFEETGEDLQQNVASLGFDLAGLARKKKLVLDYVHIDRSEIEETGEYDLNGLFIRLAEAVESVGAKRVVLDTVEALFAGLPNPAILRAELRRLFRWLKDRGLTTIITGERGEGTLTRHGLEEYVSDCVIVLDHRVREQVSTRSLRVVKYRGSTHGSNEYPFLIDGHGISVLPITSLGLDHPARTERISSGVARLDTMLGGHGYFRGSTVLVSGTAGTGKTSLSAHFVDAACRRGERCLYFAFEESPAQIVRNMRSIGLDLGRWRRRNLLRFHVARPSLGGLETHLATMHKAVHDFDPGVVVLDPMNSFGMVGSEFETKSMLTRLVDFLKSQGITGMFNSLTAGGGWAEGSEAGISSLIDTWLLLRDIESNGERNRALYILKSRGMAHSNQVREFLLTDHGVELRDVYIGPAGAMIGSARLAQEARERAATEQREQAIENKQRALERRRTALEAQIAALRAGFELEKAAVSSLVNQARECEDRVMRDQTDMALQRHADVRSPVARNKASTAGRPPDRKEERR